MSQNKWFISIKRRGRDIFDLSGLKRWKTPNANYEADPFLIKEGGKNYLFYEDYDRRKGVISYSTIEGLKVSPPTIVLETHYHLSYPQVFKEGNDFYLIPESGTERNIQLFRAVRFPDKWEPVKIIWDDGVYADSNVFKYKDKWWLFTVGGSGDNNLLILESNSLLGNWKEHVRSRIPHSRGAGNIFEYQGKLIRPVQDSSKIYGGAIIFKEITLPGYTEKIIRRIEPNWYNGLNLIGTHTFNFNEDYVIIDGKIKI